MQCEYCEKDDDGDDDVVVSYYRVQSGSHREDTIRAACGDCAENKDPVTGFQGTGILIDIPQGYQIVDRASAQEYKDSVEALNKVHKAIKDYAKRSGMIFYLHGCFDTDQNFAAVRLSLEADIKGISDQFTSLGISDDTSLNHTGAHCPCCQGPLFKMHPVKMKKALNHASVQGNNVYQIMGSKNKNNPYALVCLRCNTVYVNVKGLKK